MYQFPFHPDHIPEELKPAPHWVVCDEEKVPYIALVKARRKASSTDPGTWRSYPKAVSAFKTGRYAGIGRVIVEDEGYVGVDIDSCRDAATGRISAKAWEMLEALASYSEVSPSQNGVKVWVKASLKTAYVKAGLEIYPRGRYFTTTGQFLPQFPLSIEERTAPLGEIISREFPKPKTRPYHNGRTGKTLALDEVLEEGEVEIEAVVADMSATLKRRIICPWVNEHTNEDPSGTVVGQYENGALFFRCWHAHCRHRDWRAFRQEVAPPASILITLPKRGRSGKVVINLV